MENNKRTRIVEQSVAHFTHYGFKRTTMGEIAKLAGISRPTLYAEFDSKEDIFAAAIEWWAQDLSDELKTHTEGTTNLGDCIKAAFEVLVLKGCEAAERWSFSQELMDIEDPRVAEAQINARMILARSFAQCIEQTDADLGPLNQTTEQLAQLLQSAATGLKQDNPDTDELRRALYSLAEMTSRAVGEAR